MPANERARRGMTTSPHFLASEAGLSVLQEGGNAVEAAVAMAACLAVVYPHMTGIGGDGFWLVGEPQGEQWGVAACGAAARRATLDFYAARGLATVPWRGPLAANTVAGTVSGWALALQRAGGRLPLSRLLRDAIHYAESGIAITRGGAEIAAAKDEDLSAAPGYAAVFRPAATPLREGDLLRQPALAKTLWRIAERGCADFYTGALARDIAADLAEAGSPIGADDLAAHRATYCAPLTVRVKDARLFNLPPPTQGLSSLLILALFDRLGVEEADGFAHVHAIVEATKAAFARSRALNIGDPALLNGDPQALLDDGAAINAMAARIVRARAAPWGQVGEPGDTTWFGAVDSQGRVVSAIQSIYFEFGAGVVLPQTGITWQNRGASFQLRPSGWNALAPGRMPFHTLNPAFARFDDGRTMAYGAMGGEGQPQTQAALFTRYARFGAGLQDAVSAPRWLLGRTWGQETMSLKLESRFDASLYEDLQAAGHDVEVLAPFTSVMGHAGALVRHADGSIEGASDPRSDGAVAQW